MSAQWPPRSPHEVLASTPSGRERLRRMAERTSPSPSPSKLRSRLLITAPSSRAGNKPDGQSREEELNDDDEEMLELELQAIQARLKLKKLQAAKAKKTTSATSDAGNNLPRPASTPIGAGGLREVPLQAKLAAVRERMERPKSQNAIQVPASPVKKARDTADLQTSPQRVLLGIDKGRKATDVSLKRAPSVGKAQDNNQRGGYLRTAKLTTSGSQPQVSLARPVSFNERLATARSDEISRQERQDRINKARSTAFDVGMQEMEEYKVAAVDLPDMPQKSMGLSRNEILGLTNQTERLPGSKRYPNLQGASETEASNAAFGAETSTFEPYSDLHLSKRILPHNILTRAVSGKKTYVLKDLLRHVKAPEWELPDIEQDIVVFAIVAAKSEPRHHKSGPGGAMKAHEDRNKYMFITLVDLVYEIELFLFGSGFDRYWKITPGTVIAILNPVIMPPPKGREATGRFSLVIRSDADTILEIGTARDLGYCKSVKKDGQLCKSWVNAKRTEYCEFHTNVALERTRSSRIELNQSGFGARKYNSRQVYVKTEDDHKRGGYDRDTQSKWFVNSAHRSVGLLDDEREGGLADRAERAENLKRMNAERERERDIAKRLVKLGSGAGKEYMSRAATVSRGLGSSVSSSSSTAVDSGASTQNTAESQLPGDRPTRDARALELIAPRGQQPRIDLAPAKRKRLDSSQSSSTADGEATRSKGALGWGKSLGDKLAKMKEGERLDGRKFVATDGNQRTLTSFARRDRSPVHKKTRFVTEKGIREAGRESLGEPLSMILNGKQIMLDDNDNDDDLEIVR